MIAVKVFRLDIVPEQAQALAVALNRATESSLFHPSIVEPVGAGMEGTVAYRAEEYVAAESLDVAMRHYAPASLDKALPFLTQLAGAIDFARAAGIGHGGLHPRDIFVTPDEARATGFGVVEALDEVGIRAPVRRPYTAPERIEGADWSTPADVFSLAAIGFELLTARRPAGTGAQIGSLPDSDHAAAIHAVLARAMDEDPSKRFATALAFAAALEAAGRGESISGSIADVAAAAAPIPAAIVLEPEADADFDPRLDLDPERAADPVMESEPADEPSRAVDPTPGEFEVEKDLDPVLTAIDDDIAAERALDDADHAERTLFDDSPAEPDLDAEDIAAERFADEFVDEQEAEAESRRPLEAVHETIVPVPAEAPMFAAADHEPEHDIDDLSETTRPTMLPIALTAVICSLVAFGGGYFMGARSRLGASLGDAAPAAASAPATAAPGPATPDTPGQYSEQKVTPAAGTPASSAPPSTVAAQSPSPSATPPPVPDETSSATAPASRPAGRGAAAPSAPAARSRGRLVVKSTPSRAGVTVNGTWRGRTPLTLDDLAFGRYVVRVVQPGFAVARHDVTLNAASAAQEFTAQLERTGSAARPPARPGPRPETAPAASATTETFTGTLYVDSRPRGATVFLDGRSVGQTPLSLPEVPVGSHVVRLEMDGKKTWNTTTRVVAGQTARVTGSLDDR